MLNISFLVDQSCDAVDAVGRTLYRQWISHRHMLEWTTSAQMEQLVKQGQQASMLRQQGPIAAIATLLLILVSHPTAVIVASPFLLAWAASPWMKLYLRGRTASTPPLSSEQRATFRAYARRTWHFFETFVTEADHFLAPDNFQEDPTPVIAHRTSPTNVGLQLLAALAAADLGFIGQWQCLELLENIFDTLKSLDRYNGHFFNCQQQRWTACSAALVTPTAAAAGCSQPACCRASVSGYDSASARPLHPKYISTVDSGNLAGHLLVVKQWCKEQLRSGAVPQYAREGVIDTLIQLTREISQVKTVSITAGGVTVQQLQDGVNAAIDLVKKSRSSHAQRVGRLPAVAAVASQRRRGRPQRALPRAASGGQVR